MTHRLVIAAAALLFGIAASACTSKPTEEAKTTETPAAAPAESHEGHQQKMVSFAEPKDGATVSPQTKFVFKSDNFEISPVPKDAKEARPNVGHFHLGVDTECLPAGTPIPKADPNDKTPPGTAGKWIHFGNGSDNIEMALTPGPHKMSVEVGDDLHRAVDGLCQTINITVK